MSTALTERPAILPASPAVTPDQLDLIRRTIAKDATADELKLYLYDCARQGVHPLDKLIHFTKRSGKYTPITSIDFMRIRAADTGEYAGSDTALFASGEGIWSSLWISDTPPLAAMVTVWRIVQSQRCKFEAVARWAEYKPEQNDFMWRKMPATMLGKCAEALALRKGFPRQLAGLYAKEEMDQAGIEMPTPQSVAQRPTEGERENTSAPNVGESGDIIDASTGASRPEPPPGFFYVSGYQFNDPWHEAYLLRYDSQGGALKVSTKDRRGKKLKDAEDAGIPVQVDVRMKGPRYPGEAYLNGVTLLMAPEMAF